MTEERSFKKGHKRSISDSVISEINSSLKPPPAVHKISSLNDLGSCDKKATPLLKRKPSYFVSRQSHAPIAAIYVTSFYSELWKHCSLNGSRPSHCLNNENSYLNDVCFGNSLALLETLAGEGDLSRLCHALYLKEIRRLNLALSSGQLFVDGLYELIMQKVSLPSGNTSQEKDSNLMMKLAQSPRDIFTNNISLLNTYWERPPHCTSDDLSTYLTVSSSFVQYILTKYGSRGVAEFLMQLPQNGCDKEFRFHGNNIASLEYKWKCFVESETNNPFRLSFFGMIIDLVRKYYCKHFIKLLLICICVFLHVTLQLGLAITFSQLLTLGFDIHHNLNDVIIWCSSVLSLLLFRFILINISGLLVTIVTVKVGVDLRQRLTRRIHQISFHFFSDHTPGSVLSIYSKDVSSVENFIAVSMTTLMWACLMLCTCIVYATIISWCIGLPLGMAYLCSHAFITWISSKVSRYGFLKSQAADKSADMFKETLDGFKENRIYRCALVWLERIEGTLKKEYTPHAIRYNILIQFVISFQSIFPHFIGLLLLSGIIILTYYDWVKFGPGLSVYFMYQLTLMSMATAGGHYSTVQSAKISLSRINAILSNKSHDMLQEIPLSNTTFGSQLLKSRISCRGKKGVSVVFDRVCFCYAPTSSHWTLYNVSFKIKPGERIALLGQTGSGKSTIISLLLQLLQPSLGSILIDGSQTIGRPDGTAVAIFQYNHIFGTTIRDNISLGHVNVTDEEIIHVSQLAGLHDWISSLPRGYDTPIKPGTCMFSGGQRQRIAIARMLLSNAPVLLLDEVTSALDPLTASRVFSTLMSVTKGRTVIAVTHQIEQARCFDRVIVISHGQIKEIGTHTELLCQRGLYHRLVLQEEGVVSPSKPTPIRRRHSLTHIVTTPTPQIIVTKPTPAVGATSLVTLSEEPSLLRSSVVFETGSREKPIRSLSETGCGHEDISENPFPCQLAIPSSTPYKV